MNSAKNSALFTDVSAEESSTLNGGLLGYEPRYRRRTVFNPFTGRYTTRYYAQWVPSGTLNLRYLQ